MPTFERVPDKLLLRLSLAALAVLALLSATHLRVELFEEGLLLTSLNFRLALYANYLLVGILILLAALAWLPGRPARIADRLATVQGVGARLGAFSLPLILTMLVAYPLLLFSFYGRYLSAFGPRWLLFALISLLAAALWAGWRRSAWLPAWLGSLLALAVVYNAGVFLSEVTSFPFALGWSETSRFYKASLFFGERIYGVDTPWPVTHPSRYMLLSLPFLIDGLPLWAHRLWQALLWLAMASVTGVALAHYLGLNKGRLFWMFAAWVYLYLMQGAVFYHLLPCVFIVLFSFDRRRFWRSLLFVILASLWAGVSRINWAPLPGSLAAMLYLLETPFGDDESALSLKYWWQPTAYFLTGTLSALGAYWLYIFSSGNEDLSQFSSSFTSALLWDRLLPNLAFPLGILPGIILVSLPLFAIIYLQLRRAGRRLHGLRRAAVLVILLVFFAGGLVVSVKIGGGTNLHNLDAYMVLLLIFAAMLAFGRVNLDGKKPVQIAPARVPWALLLALLTIPIFFALSLGEPLNLPGRRLTDDALNQIQVRVDEALAEGQQVLFISQRHLLTFGLVDAPLIHDDEKLFLMEMAISGNDPYLRRFAHDIDQQQFGVIISDPLFNQFKDVAEDPLAPENNAWVRFVTRPVLCAYYVETFYEELSLQILTPDFGNKCDS